MNETSEPREDLRVEMPPHARLAGLEFQESAGALRVTFTDGDERTIAADQIIALCGASIRTEMTSLAVEQNTVSSAVVFPLGSARARFHPGPQLTSEGAMLIVALRTAPPSDLLYFVADSFNFRNALGAEAGYSTEMNLRALVRRLAALAPGASRDDFVMAIIHRVPLPPPMASLMEFFKANAAV
ncbi:MAG TPA: hypothetical protein VGX02_03300 [Candidatus Eremiobacteraceae bacterium]|nr:hypothetical protein [Candidatus Eremiobacteraceae bacterium]